MDIGFAPNYTHLYEVDITPNESSRTWARVGCGIATIEPDGNEEVDQTGYYDGDGGTTSDVTGGQMTISVTGHRVYGDPFQDYCSALSFSYGTARKTKMRVTNPDGEVITSDITIANIKAMAANGDANAKGDFECELHCDGAPTVSAPVGDVLPDTVTASPVAVAVGATSTISPEVLPPTASARCVFAVEDDAIATVDGDGTVTGVKAGTTKLSVKCAAKPSVHAIIDVTVSTNAG